MCAVGDDVDFTLGDPEPEEDEEEESPLEEDERWLEEGKEEPENPRSKKRKSFKDSGGVKKKPKTREVQVESVKDWQQYLKREPSLAEIQKMVDELNKDNGTKRKLEVLSKHPHCVKALYYVYNPFWQYHVKAVTCKKVKAKLELRTLAKQVKSVFLLLDMLREKKVVGNAAIATINYFVSFNRKYQDCIYNMLDKNLKIRLNTTSLNKVFPGLLPEFSVALAEKYHEHPDAVNLDDTWLSSQKMDGVRVITFCFSPTNIRFFSRTGKEFTTLKVVETRLKKLELYNVVLDGEMCIIKSDGSEDFKAIVSQIKKQTGFVQRPKYYIFDMLTMDEFNAKNSTRTFTQRINEAKQIIGESTLPYLTMLEQTEIKDENHITALWEESRSKKWEGLIFRRDAAYIGQRSVDMLKMKEFQDNEFVVLRIETGPYRLIKNGKETTVQTMTAAIIKLDDAGNTVSVGSGWSVKERETFYKNPKALIGSWITVQYFSESQDKNGKPSLRFPTFKAIRDMTLE